MAISASAGTSSPGSLLLPYVPRLLSEWSPTVGEPRHMRVTGSLAFVDISGFTKLTERLARKGKVGAEEMSDTLSATFASLLSVTRADDADLVKWGGDAVLLLFRGRDHAARAARSAYLMRQTLRTVGRLVTTSGAITLRMSVGIHSGDFDFFLVGDPAVHRELLISGPGASATAAMEATATAGQIGLTAATAALLPERLLGRPVDGGRLLRSQPRLDDLVVLPRQPASFDPATVLPRPIRAHLQAGTGEPEHRAVAVAFVQFSGTDDLLRAEGPAALAEALDACVRNVQSACADHDITFFESDINRDGGKIMLIAGAPRSSGHDEERMLRAARLVMDRAGRLPLRIGVNRGHVFAGDFGPDFRRTYSVKGDAINLAARVMGKAEPGQVLATRQAVERSATLFETTDLPPFLVKGKSQPVLAAAIGPIRGSRQEENLRLPMVGRADELAVLRAALDDVRHRRGRLVEVVGEPGIGKSRLVEELLAEAGDVAAVTSPCEEYSSTTPYFPFRRLLRRALGLTGAASAAEVTSRLTQRADSIAPKLVEWLPLLGVLLDVELPATTATADLDDKFRKARLESVACDFLELLVPSPTVLVIEDAHLIDEASADLLQAMARRLDRVPWLLLVTRRERSSGFVAPPDAGAVTVRPAPLEPEAALSLLNAALDDNPLPHQTVEALAARAGGNPMFLEALVAEATRSGAVSELPESVEALVTSQIDRLDPADRTVLRYAAVLGSVVEEDDLVALLDAHAERPPAGTLDRLGGFLHRDRPGRLRFRHSLMRDVAYEGLPFRRRRLLHDHVGQRIESTAASPEAQCELLSLHFFHAGRYDRAWHYSVLAGDRALAKYANVEAIGFFRRAVASARPAGTAGSDDLSAVLEHLGDALFRVGLADEAAGAFADARRHVTDDALRLALLTEKQAQVDERMRRLSVALRRITASLNLLDGRTDRAARLARSRLARRYALSRYWQGRADDALHWAQIAAHEAEEAVDKDALARAYEVLNAVHVGSGRSEPLPYGRLALQAYTELGNLPHQAHCLNNLGLQAFDADRWQEALELYGRASSIFRRIGDSANEGNVLYNEAEVLIRQRRFADAEQLVVSALRIARSVHDRELVALILREDARRLSAVEGLDPARERLLESQALFQELNELGEAEANDLVLAELLLDHAATGEAATLLDRLGVAADTTAPSVPTARLVARLQVLQDRAADARRILASALESLEGTGARYERALVMLGLADADERLGADATAMRQDAEASLQALGVVTEGLTGAVSRR